MTGAPLKGRTYEEIHGTEKAKELRNLRREHRPPPFRKGANPWNKDLKGSQVPWNKGLTKETDERVAKYSSSLVGHQITEVVRIKISNSLKGKTAKELNANWKGGKSFEPYPCTFDQRLKDYIKRRDGFLCRLCGALGDALGRLYVHHINYNKWDCRPENLITLCARCSGKVNYNRDYWKKRLGRLIRND